MWHGSALWGGRYLAVETSVLQKAFFLCSSPLSHEKELRAKLSESLYNECRKRDRL